LDELWCKTGQTGAINEQVHAMKSGWNFSQRTHRSTPLDPKLMFWAISDRSVTARNLVQNGWNGAFNANFIQQICVGIFSNERYRSTPLDPKLIFWGISDHFVTTRNLVQNGLNWSN
jgi:hypothetical protein